MLTPIFELTQDDKFVIALIYAPYAKIDETELEFEGREFIFSSKPYFLRLFLPEEVVENESASATYDVDSKKFTVKIPKKVEGRHFPDLDMITRLLTPPGKANANRLVEEISNSQDSDEEEEEEPSWFAEQQMPSVSKEENILKPAQIYGYGFANRRYGVFDSLREELSEIIEIKTPDDFTIAERFRLAHEKEREKFSDDHYLADYFNFNEEIEPLLENTFFWTAASSKSSAEFQFSDEERDRMKNLPKKSISLESNEEMDAAFFSLVDIIFAYAYDYRTTGGEHNVESGWTISKLSATLSCLIRWHSAREAVISSVRRSLCYPLFRNWNLSMQILKDVREIFEKGKGTIIKCLLDIHRLFSCDNDDRYLFNDLYITDYCVWMQSVSDAILLQYVETLKPACDITKNDVDLDLEELETAGSLALSESLAEKERELDSDDEEAEENLIRKVQNLNVTA